MTKKTFKIRGHLAEALRDTVVSAQNNAGELHIEIVPIRKITLDPENPRDLTLNIDDVYNGIKESDPDFTRKEAEKNALASMSKSIVEQGVINPIVVYQLGEQYRLIAGERRILASIIARKDDIPARVLTSKPNALKLSLIQWIENIEREDLSLWERMQNLEKIFNAYTKRIGRQISDTTATDISKLIGCSLQQGVNYRSILNATPELIDHIKSGEIKSIDKAAFISNASKAIQQNLIKSCVDGATLSGLKKIAEEGKINTNKIKAGRPSAAINLGSTNSMKIAKNILTAILNHNRHISHHFGDINWDDHKSISFTFKKLLRLLETA